MRRENNSNELVDRISALPDSILGVILSFLPTKNAVATSILSKRWKFVWVTVHNLDLCQEGCLEEHTEGEDLKFVRIVNRVLLLHDGGFLNKFRLVWNPMCISSSHASSWIDTAITRKVHELFLCVETHVGQYNFIREPFEMQSVFTCDSLRSLELNGGISVPEAVVVGLPRLESLKLVSVHFQSEEAFEKLISGCPMLNYLHLNMDIDQMADYFGIHYDFTYIISSTSLKRLELYFNYESHLPEEIFNCLKLEASSLEYLKIVGFISEIYLQKKLSSLVEADFRIELRRDNLPVVEICDLIVEAIDAFGHAKSLTLSADATWCPCQSERNLTSKFKRLVKLEAKVYCCCHCWPLQHVIENLKKLEVLTIYQVPSDEHEPYHEHYEWGSYGLSPRFFSKRLKLVVLNGYNGYEDEREMIRYILKHGIGLEVMKISYDKDISNKKKLELVHEICKFPRKSPTCQVEFF